jgi:hypothetical protein
LLFSSSLKPWESKRKNLLGISKFMLNCKAYVRICKS